MKSAGATAAAGTVASSAAGSPSNNTAREVIHLDPAYSLEIVRKRGQLQFVECRNRAGYFSFVWGVHPFVGMLGSHWAGRIREERFTSDQIVFDGFEKGPNLPRWLIPLNVMWALVRLLGKLAKIARRPEVKAIFAADAFGTGLLGLALSKLSGKPLLVGVYGNQDENWQFNGMLASPRLLPSRKLEQMVSRAVLRNAEMIEVGSQNLREYVTRNGANSENVVFLPAVKFISDVHFSEPSERPDPRPFLASRGVPEARVYLLTVSRLLRVKHTDDVIPAMEVVLRQRPDVVGLLAGTGDLEDVLRADIARRGLRGRIILLGDCDHPTLAALAPHCITLSPLTGMALIETSLAGSPPVVYDCDWQPEFVSDGQNGFVVQHRDAVAMGEKALLLASDDGLRRRLGSQSRRAALAFADRDKKSVRERAAMAAALERGATLRVEI